MSEESIVFHCVNHPAVETSLRCNSCENPICPKCAVLTPTGYRCKSCVRSHQKIYETAKTIDIPLAIGIAGVLSFLGSLIASPLGFLSIFVAPIAGVIIAEAVRFAVRRRRAKRLTQATGIAAAIGALPLLVYVIFSIFIGFGLYRLLDLVWQGYYAFMVTSTVLYRLGGIRIQ